MGKPSNFLLKKTPIRIQLFSMLSYFSNTKVNRARPNEEEKRRGIWKKSPVNIFTRGRYKWNKSSFLFSFFCFDSNFGIPFFTPHFALSIFLLSFLYQHKKPLLSQRVLFNLNMNEKKIHKYWSYAYKHSHVNPNKAEILSGWQANIKWKLKQK